MYPCVTYYVKTAKRTKKGDDNFRNIILFCLPAVYHVNKTRHNAYATHFLHLPRDLLSNIMHMEYEHVMRVFFKNIPNNCPIWADRPE